MEKATQQVTRYFATYEAREEAFGKSAFSLIPRKYLGPGPFWKDFNRISREGFAAMGGRSIAVITSNPRDCLAFGTPRQVLAAACMCAASADAAFDMSETRIADIFGLAEKRHQPVRTLSGGETVKLALAKSYVSAASAHRLAVSSPFSWLSLDNRSDFSRVLERYRRLALPVEIFALEEEDSECPITGEESRRFGTLDRLAFSLRMQSVRFDMGTSLNALYAHHTRVDIGDFHADLSSPCLFVGGNGQGKSLVARILADAIAYEGSAGFRATATSGRARLLFQDVVAQTLLRSFRTIAGGDGEILALFKEITDIYNRIKYFGASAESAAVSPAASVSGSLLGTKAILTAARLGQRPGALILDEPDWGMSRSDAVCFVAAVIRVAHSRGVPVVIISHKPWWGPIAGSRVHIGRTPTRSAGDRQSRFSIAMRSDSGGEP